MIGGQINITANPLDFWRAIPQGSNIPASLLEELDSESLYSGVHNDYSLRSNGFSIHTNYDTLSYSKELPADQNFNSVSLTNIFKMNSYIFEIQGKCYSVKDIMQKYTVNPIDFYFFDSEHYDEVSPMYTQFINYRGEISYEIFSHKPKTLLDILEFLHELGHIILDEKIGSYYQNILQTLTEDPKYQLIQIKFKNRLEILSFKRKITITDIISAGEELYSYSGHQKYLDIVMQLELDAWSCAHHLMQEIGLDKLINSEDLTEAIMYCVKTRIP